MANVSESAAVDALFIQ